MPLLRSFLLHLKRNDPRTEKTRAWESQHNHINAEGQKILGKVTATAVEEFYKKKANE
jgi:hypothetical protein